ncbi:MAG: DUF2569 family protein [Candidatus Acidiferrales bacterium]
MDPQASAGMSRTSGPSFVDGVDYRYFGVSGWLLCFIFTLVFIGPAVRVYSLFENYGHSMQVFAESRHSSALHVYYFVEQFISFAVRGYGLFAGIELWKVRPGAVQKAKLFLLSLFALAFLEYASEFVWVFLTATVAARDAALSRVANGHGAEFLFEAGIYAGVWYAYLLKSKRVRATFSSENRLDITSIPHAGID